MRDDSVVLPPLAVVAPYPFFARQVLSALLKSLLFGEFMRSERYNDCALPIPA
jgi:hypothetical protein